MLDLGNCVSTFTPSTPYHLYEDTERWVGFWPTPLPLPLAFYRWENEKLRSKRRVEWLAPVHMYSWIWTEVFPSLSTTTSISPGKHSLDYIFLQPAMTDRTYWVLSHAPPCTSTATGLEGPPLSPSGPMDFPNTPPWHRLCSCTCFHHGHLPHGTETLHLPVCIIGLWAPWGQGLCVIHLWPWGPLHSSRYCCYNKWMNGWLSRCSPALHS